MGPDQQCRIALRFDEDTDHRRYNLPTATSNEIAVIIPGDGDQPASGRDIVLYRHGGGLKEISDIHPLYPSLHYVLLFPTGQLGWHPKIPYMQKGNQANQNQANQANQDNQNNQGNLDNLDNLENLENQANQNQAKSPRNKVTQSEYFKYCLHPRNNESNHIFMAGKLFQEYVVDAWATTEQGNLNYVKHNQKKIRAHTYQGLADAVTVDPDANVENTGQ